MPRSPSSANIPLTLIVAATPEMGIGFKSTLPWPSLKSEMAYFSRVTRRASPSHINAVIMGRRTWESIPPKFRPLKERVNVVISRRPESLELGAVKDGEGRKGGPIAAGGIVDALGKLRADYGEGKGGGGLQLEKVFVIGGAEIYSTALGLENTKRILLTRLRTNFECDTFFPLGLDDSGAAEGESAGGSGKESKVWRRRSKAELDAWTGEEVPGGVQQDGDVRWEYEMWELDD